MSAALKNPLHGARVSTSFWLPSGNRIGANLASSPRLAHVTNSPKLLGFYDYPIMQGTAGVQRLPTRTTMAMESLC
jgi:hypothetical protein